MAGEKAPISFEDSQNKIKVLLGLNAVDRADLLGTVTDLEQSGAEEVRRDPRRLGHFAEWMIYAVDGVARMNANGKVRPPVDGSVIEALDVKRDTYSKFEKSASEDATPDQPDQPERTADRKS